MIKIMSTATEDDIRNDLNFINKVMAQEPENGEQVFAFLKKFKEISSKEEVKLPYHINVIDELNANENAHSRILAKLLQQKNPESNRFEILESFVQYLKKKSDSFCNITIENPDITQETERIDLWVRDKTYAIIIENKIHYADDKERQLERYIDKTKAKSFRNEQIFVIYLSPRYEEPDIQSWGKYKDEFQERYLNLSFNDDILLWLKEKVLPNVKLRDVFLRSAIEQYIDHLEGIFSLRTINNKMNMELQEFIKGELGLTGNPMENIAKLSAKQEEINSFTAQCYSLREKAEKEIPAYFKNRMSEKYKNYEYVEKNENQWGIEIAGLIIPMDNIKVRVYIGLDFSAKQLFCQVDTGIESQKTATDKFPDLPERVYERIKFLPKNNKGDNTQIWEYFDRYDYDGVFKCFQEVMRILTQ